jgi:hypothetical protein
VSAKRISIKCCFHAVSACLYCRNLRRSYSGRTLPWPCLRLL